MAKYIYWTENRGYHVLKRINGKPTSFGFYPNINSAEFVRDELEKENWNKNALKGIVKRMLLKGELHNE